MLHFSAVGTPDAVERWLAEFAQAADADELMIVHAARSIEARLRSVELIAGSDH